MSNRRRIGSRLIAFGTGILGLLVSWACNGPASEPKVGSNSNWLHACQSAAECEGVNACTCGGCTIPCSRDADCAGLTGARCAPSTSPATWAACQSVQPSIGGVCLPTCEFGTCGASKACIGGFCSLLTIPDSAYCSGVSHWSEADRAHEDELLALLQQSRTFGGVACGSSEASGVVSALRLDARLTCAARSFAIDLGNTASTSLTDSQGRTTQDRISLSGYVHGYWGEGFVRSTGSAADAYVEMLDSNSICPELVSANFVDVGIGVSGSVYVVTLAAP